MSLLETFLCKGCRQRTTEWEKKVKTIQHKLDHTSSLSMHFSQNQISVFKNSQVSVAFSLILGSKSFLFLSEGNL
jgi:hypothetical protein